MALAAQPKVRFLSKAAARYATAEMGADLNAPALHNFIVTHSDSEIAELVRHGRRAMPAHDVAEPEMVSLLSFLRVLMPQAHETLLTLLTLCDGSTLSGHVLNESAIDLQLQAADGQIHRLEKVAGRYRPKP